MNLLFWNIYKKNIANLITSLVFEEDVDILMLAESGIEDKVIIPKLNSRKSLYTKSPGESGRVRTYTRYTHNFITPIIDTGKASISNIKLPLSLDVLIVAVHLGSKYRLNPEEQAQYCSELLITIDEAENKVGHNRTIVIGDFNMNPFESGIVSAIGLHAIMDRNIVNRGKRILDGKPRKYFYNPMWNRFGDKTVGPPGTYYKDTGTPINYYWYMFDQLLIRPDLLGIFSDDNLKIITEINSKSLLSSSGKPDKRVASDHLPLLLKLEI